MRGGYLLILVCACSNPQPEVAEPPVDPVPLPISDPVSPPPAASAPDRAAPQGSAAPEGETEQEWTIEKGTAKDAELTNAAGATLKLKTLGWTSFRRTTEAVGANVSFATVSADDAVVSEVSCTLPAWPEAPNDPATMAAKLVPLVAKDAVPAAAIAKIKPALLACGSGKPLRILWDFKDDKFVTSRVEAADAKTSACVKGALAKVFILGSGVCVATVAP